nr:hypothetical protein [Angustibacter aerolatus]
MLSQSLKKQEDGLRLGADHYFATSDPETFEQARGPLRPDRQHGQRADRRRRLPVAADDRRHAGQRRRPAGAVAGQRLQPHRRPSLVRRLDDRRHRRDPGDARLLRRARAGRRGRGHLVRPDQRRLRAGAGVRRPLPVRDRRLDPRLIPL